MYVKTAMEHGSNKFYILLRLRLEEGEYICMKIHVLVIDIVIEYRLKTIKTMCFNKNKSKRYRNTYL